MTLKLPRFLFGLSGIATPSATLASGDVRVGLQQVDLDLPSTALYALRIQSTSGADAVRIALSTGAVTITAGAPIITDGNGKDFEGKTLPAIVSCDAILLSMLKSSSPGGTVTSTLRTAPGGGTTRMVVLLEAGGVASCKNVRAITTDVLEIAFAQAGDFITIVIAGQATGGTGIVFG